MSGHVLFFIGFVVAFFASLSWLLFKLYRTESKRSEEYLSAYERKCHEVENLKAQAAAYAEEKRKNEQKLNEAASHSRPGFNSSLELMQQLAESGSARNN